jgi:hypothetical protein
MTLYGIFDKNKNHKLLRYSTVEQVERKYMQVDGPGLQPYKIWEVCYPNIEYSTDKIGQEYDPNTGTWKENS